jgi:hypothetical protein
MVGQSRSQWGKFDAGNSSLKLVNLHREFSLQLLAVPSRVQQTAPHLTRADLDAIPIR